MLDTLNPIVLTEDEDIALARCEATIEQGLQTFYAVGSALTEIRDGRLYRATHSTFEDYCEGHWGMGRNYANKLIAAAETVDNLGTTVPILPAAERHIRPITDLPPDQQRAVWQRAVDTAPNGKMTAAHVQQVREEIAPRIVHVQPTPENEGLIGDGEDDTWDPPMEPAQVADLPPPRINAGLFTSATPEWYTPRHVIDRVLKVFCDQVDLDPCSNSDDPGAANVPARHYWTQHTDGITQSWQVEDYTRVYMNPPYGDEVAQWVDRLIQAFEGEEIREAIALLPARIDTAWFRPLWDYALCFVYGRLRFSGAENSAPFPSVLVYMGPDIELFKAAFSDIGRCGVFR